MKAITVGVLYKTKRRISRGAVLVQGQAGPGGSLLRFLGGRGEGHGAAGFGCWRGCHPTAPLGEFKRVPTDFFALQLPPVIHFTWENEEEKCGIQTHVQSRFLEIP